jgi:hypothetical protein
MTDERRPPSDCRWARQVAALLRIGVVVVILVLDVLVDASTAVLVPLLLTVAGLLCVDLPRLTSCVGGDPVRSASTCPSTMTARRPMRASSCPLRRRTNLALGQSVDGHLGRVG